MPTNAQPTDVGILISEAKAGWKTTEFWITVVMLILNNVSALPIPDKYQGLINVVMPAIYALSRGLAKHGIPSEAILPGDPSLNADPLDRMGAGDKV